MVTRLQDLDPLSPVRLARNRAQFVYLAASVIVLSDALDQPIGCLSKYTQHDYATVEIGPKTYSFGWKLDPLASQSPTVRLRRTCYTLGFLLRDRNPTLIFLIALALLVLVVICY